MSEESGRHYEILDHAPIGVLVLEAEMRVVFWNATLELWTGLQRAEILGSDLRKRFQHLSRPRYARRLAQLLEGGAPAVFSSQLHPHFLPAPLPSGRLRVLETLAVSIPAAEGSGFHVLVAIQDVSSLMDAMDAVKEARREAERLAATDSLTGLANRRSFFEQAAKAISNARRYGAASTLMMLDLDEFKLVNDRHGHAAGDELLRQVASALQRSVRQGDLVARMGGDEFVALLVHADVETALVSAGRLRAVVRDLRLDVGGVEIGVAISIGIAGLVDSVTDVDGLLLRADRALYEAKRQGRDEIVVAGDGGSAS